MGYSPEEQRQKEIIKSAVVEALEQHQGWRTKPAPARKSTAWVIAIWVLILAAAIGLYNLVEVSARP